MTADILEQVNRLPLAKQQEIENFIHEIISKNDQADQDGMSIAEMRKKNMGWAKGMVWMADDFNETPQDFKDYL